MLEALVERRRGLTFEEFAHARLRSWLRVAQGLSGDPYTAEDLVQEVLIKVHSNWARVRDAQSPDAYVHRMLVNEATSWRRKWARMIPSELAERDEQQHVDDADRFAVREVLDAALQTLPRRQRVVMVLRYFGGLDDAEIATVMGCSAGTVRGYAARALASLRLDPVTVASLRAEGV